MCWQASTACPCLTILLSASAKFLVEMHCLSIYPVRTIFLTCKTIDFTFTRKANTATRKRLFIYSRISETGFFTFTPRPRVAKYVTAFQRYRIKPPITRAWAATSCFYSMAFLSLVHSITSWTAHWCFVTFVLSHHESVTRWSVCMKTNNDVVQYSIVHKSRPLGALSRTQLWHKDNGALLALVFYLWMHGGVLKILSYQR